MPPLNKDQLLGLNAAFIRSRGGTASATDKSNLSSGFGKGFVPTGFEKISGAEFPTAEKQKAAFSSIRPVGEVGKSGSFLIGERNKPTTPLAPTKPSSSLVDLSRSLVNKETPAKPTPTIPTPNIPSPNIPSPTPTPTPTITQPTQPAKKTLTEKLADVQGRISSKVTGSELAEVQHTGDILGREGQGRGITTGLIEGQQAFTERERQLARQTEGIELAGLQREEANILSQIQSAKPDFRTVGNKILQFNQETGVFDTVFEDIEQAQKPIEIDGQLVQFNSETGEFEVVFGEKEIPDSEKLQFIKGDKFNKAGTFDPNTNKFTPLDENLINRSIAGSTGKLDADQISTATDLSKQVKGSASFKDMSDIETGFIGVFNGVAQDNGFGDIAAINAFQRMIDPGATVREGDVTLLQSASAFLKKVAPDFVIDKLEKGDKLPPSVREQMKKLANELYTVRRNNYENSISTERNLSAASGIDFNEFVAREFPTANELSGLPTADTTGGGEVTDEEFEILKSEFPELSDEEIRSLSFSNVGGDTNSAQNRPQGNNNPGNVKRGGIADKFALKDENGNPKVDDQNHLIFPDSDSGFKGLSSDLNAKINGRSRVVKNVNPTILELDSIKRTRRHR